MSTDLFADAYESLRERTYKLDDVIDIMLMRHGRSRADDEMVHEGRYDSPLTDVGRAQLRARAEEWKRAGVTFDMIFVSTMARAAESAQIVGETLGVHIEYDPDWMELDNGPLAGLPFDEGRKRYPRPDISNPFQPYIESTGEGESSWDLMIRGARALQRVVRRGARSSLVVAHGGTLNAAMYCILGLPAPTRGSHSSGVTFAFGDAGFVRTSYNAARHVWVVREMGVGD